MDPWRCFCWRATTPKKPFGLTDGDEEFGCGRGGFHLCTSGCMMPTKRTPAAVKPFFPWCGRVFPCRQENIEGRTFQQYLTYHFNYWMASGGISAMFELLVIGILTLLTLGFLADQRLTVLAFVGAVCWQPRCFHLCHHDAGGPTILTSANMWKSVKISPSLTHHVKFTSKSNDHQPPLTIYLSIAVLHIFCQDSPVRGLWLCTVWASAASVDPAVTAMEGGVGMIATFGGLVLLAVLLTTISDFFAEQQRKSNEGRDPIVEGGHLVLLGLSSQTKQFLEELLGKKPQKPVTQFHLTTSHAPADIFQVGDLRGQQCPQNGGHFGHHAQV